jgi:hypothetical protein
MCPVSCPANAAAGAPRKGTRLITTWKQAVFVLAWFRKNEDIPLLGAGFGLSRPTACRYHAEGVKVLAAQAPDLTGPWSESRTRAGPT